MDPEGHVHLILTTLSYKNGTRVGTFFRGYEFRSEFVLPSIPKQHLQEIVQLFKRDKSQKVLKISVHNLNSLRKRRR